MGIGTDNLVTVRTDTNGKMIPQELEEEIKRTIQVGKIPFFVNATAGTTVLGAFDDFEAISVICKKYQIWLHIDVSICI